MNQLICDVMEEVENPKNFKAFKSRQRDLLFPYFAVPVTQLKILFHGL